MSNTREKSPERDFTLQKYILLQAQHESLGGRLQSSSAHPINRRSSAYSLDSPSSSPPSKRRSSIAYPASASSSQTTVSSSIPRSESEIDEEKLHEVNQQIKATLTSLLNCDTVKHDGAFRSWVQSRLMDAELELREEKRRRSSASGETVENIKQMLE